MDDLISSQIRESCKLALPNGLKELMSDISREVLRYQPEYLYDFIADYLSVLLVTRENLTVASRLCKDLTCQDYAPRLKDELMHIGLEDSEAVVAQDLIMEYFEGDTVPKNEANLMMMLMSRIDVDEVMLAQIQLAIRKAYLRHRTTRTLYESSSESGKDEVECAGKHTLAIYRNTKPSQEDYSQMSRKIQAAYRGYGVTRKKMLTSTETPSGSKSTRRNITFHESVNATTWEHHHSIISASSVSLAGSLVHLPKHVPYSAHEYDTLSELEELPEREHCNYDYTAYVTKEYERKANENNYNVQEIEEDLARPMSASSKDSDSIVSEHLPVDVVLGVADVVDLPDHDVVDSDYELDTNILE